MNMHCSYMTGAWDGLETLDPLNVTGRSLTVSWLTLSIWTYLFFCRCSTASEDLMQRLGQDMFNPMAPYQSQPSAAALPPPLPAHFPGSHRARSSLFLTGRTF